MKDFLGTEITAGCRLVYPVRRGSSMNLRLMQVHTVTDSQIHGIRDDGRSVKVQSPNNCVVVNDRSTSCPTAAGPTDDAPVDESTSD